REANGLAMSSRNERLDPATKEEAGVIHASLQLAKAKFGMESVQYIKERVRQAIGEHPGFVLEYFEMADEADLLPLDTIVQGRAYRAFIAVYADGVRLIDNLRLN